MNEKLLCKVQLSYLQKIFCYRIIKESFLPLESDEISTTLLGSILPRVHLN